MAADKTLLKEIENETVRNATPEAKRAFIKRIDRALEDFNRSDVLDKFDEYAQKHGRVITALCIAGTLIHRKERLEGWGLSWALDIAGAWHNKPIHLGATRAAIHDLSLHPTRICAYARGFIECNSVN